MYRSVKNMKIVSLNLLRVLDQIWEGARVLSSISCCLQWKLNTVHQNWIILYISLEITHNHLVRHLQIKLCLYIVICEYSYKIVV